MVTISPELIQTREGENATLNCSATGVGDFEYQWFINNTRLIPDQNTSTFIISNIKDVDSGNYTCNVTNPYGGTGHSGITRLVILGTYI